MDTSFVSDTSYFTPVLCKGLTLLDVLFSVLIVLKKQTLELFSSSYCQGKDIEKKNKGKAGRPVLLNRKIVFILKLLKYFFLEFKFSLMLFTFYYLNS